MPTADIVLSRPGTANGGPRRRYIEPYGSTLVMNIYLQLAVLGLSLVAVGLIVLNLRTQRALRHVTPLVIRIDDVGRATALSEASLTYTPQAPEQYAESLYFLDGRLADATIDANKKAGTIERFLTDGSAEIEVHVRNVTLDDLRQPPYRATVEFDQVSLAPSTRSEIERETHVAHVVFVLKDLVDNARIPINPLGLTITYFRDDQAFVTEAARTARP